MKPREVTAEMIGKQVRVKAGHVEIAGTLESVTHRRGEALYTMGAIKPVRIFFVTDLVIAGHELEALLDGSEVEVL